MPQEMVNFTAKLIFQVLDVYLVEAGSKQAGVARRGSLYFLGAAFFFFVVFFLAGFFLTVFFLVA